MGEMVFWMDFYLIIMKILGEIDKSIDFTRFVVREMGKIK